MAAAAVAQIGEIFSALDEVEILIVDGLRRHQRRDAK
jgi:hypothetical protein